MLKACATHCVGILRSSHTSTIGGWTHCIQQRGGRAAARLRCFGERGVRGSCGRRQRKRESARKLDPAENI